MTKTTDFPLSPHNNETLIAHSSRVQLRLRHSPHLSYARFNSLRLPMPRHLDLHVARSFSPPMNVQPLFRRTKRLTRQFHI